MTAERIMITGANGLLGQYLLAALAQGSDTILATGKGEPRFPVPARPELNYASLDITDGNAVRQMVQNFQPTIILHGAAMTAADPCETDPEACQRINVEATRVLAEAARETGAFLVFMSTDFVFDGEAGPYSETDPTAPINRYGWSKLEGERLVQEIGCDWAIIRTVLVYGNTHGGTRSHFISWVRDNVQAGKPIKVVGDQLRTPTYAGDLAQGMLAIARKRASGIVNLAGPDQLTPYDMALATCAHLGLDSSGITKVDASIFTQPAKRPLRTGLLIDKARREIDFSPLSFQEGLARVLAGDGI